MTSWRQDNDNDDKGLFRKAVSGTRPLKQDRKSPHKPRRKPVPLQRHRDDQEVMASLLSDDFSPDIETGEELLFVRSGIQERVLRKLRRGQFAIEAELDLHGYIVPEAREVIAVFLRDALSRQALRAHHPRQGPRRRRPAAGAEDQGEFAGYGRRTRCWHSARRVQQDGGTGAVYVLLKKA